MTTSNDSIRKQILEQATEIIAGEREDTYGGPEDSFAVIADLWSVYFQSKGHDILVVPTDVALMMDLLKTARLIANPTHRDSWIDKAGYAACGAECAL